MLSSYQETEKLDVSNKFIQLSNKHVKRKKNVQTKPMKDGTRLSWQKMWSATDWISRILTIERIHLYSEDVENHSYNVNSMTNTIFGLTSVTNQSVTLVLFFIFQKTGTTVQGERESERKSVRVRFKLILSQLRIWNSCIFLLYVVYAKQKVSLIYVLNRF